MRRLSHPTWVRGLKPTSDGTRPSTPVAPYVGAWIETRPTYRENMTQQSHPTWVRGLKLTSIQLPIITYSRTLRGCVD